ncbi:hypothetical protein IW262DRAFT_1298118 [Armillaria fumosa]|nr:hypothetical protein IW262DRAFT_1298118 [Armillaria fumosa]
MTTAPYATQKPFKWHIKALFAHGNGEHKPQTTTTTTTTLFWAMTMTTAMGEQDGESRRVAATSGHRRPTMKAMAKYFGASMDDPRMDQMHPATLVQPQYCAHHWQPAPCPTSTSPTLPRTARSLNPSYGAMDDPTTSPPPFSIMGNALVTSARHRSPCLLWNSGQTLPPAIDAAHKQAIVPKMQGNLLTPYNALMVQLVYCVEVKSDQYSHGLSTDVATILLVNVVPKKIVMGTNKTFKKYTKRTGREHIGPRKIEAQGNCQKEDIWDRCQVVVGGGWDRPRDPAILTKL